MAKNDGNQKADVVLKLTHAASPLTACMNALAACMNVLIGCMKACTKACMNTLRPGGQGKRDSYVSAAMARSSAVCDTKYLSHVTHI